MAGLCEGGNEPPRPLKATRLRFQKPILLQHLLPFDLAPSFLLSIRPSTKFAETLIYILAFVHQFLPIVD
ncbi:hypothetical protein ANN_03525, partial [Periplaneta americana]